MLMSYCRDIPQDGDVLVAEYNADLEMLKQASRGTWFKAPWLYAEWVRPLSKLRMTDLHI